MDLINRHEEVCNPIDENLCTVVLFAGVVFTDALATFKIALLCNCSIV